MVNSLKFLHKNLVIHRDIKLGNFMLGDNMVCKIGDFGLAAKLDYTGQIRK